MLCFVFLYWEILLLKDAFLFRVKLLALDEAEGGLNFPRFASNRLVFVQGLFALFGLDILLPLAGVLKALLLDQ